MGFAMSRDYAITVPGDLAIELYNSDWTLAGPVLDVTSFELKEYDDGLKTLKFTMPLEDLQELGLYSGACLLSPVVVYIRGTERFSGIVSVCDDEDRDGGGSEPDDIVSDVNIEAVVDWQYHTTGREVKGTGGDRYGVTTAKPDDAVASVIDVNCKTGSVIEPTEYATLGTGVTRDNFGAHLVQASSSSAHPDTITAIRWPHGESLWHSIMEACRRYDLYITSSWNKAASPPLMTIAVNYPRQGTDKTATVIFEREGGGSLVKMSRKVDHLRNANVAEVQGRGVRDTQTRGFAINQASYNATGLRETGDLWPDGWQDDVDEEAGFIIAQVGGSSTTYKAVLRETEGRVVGVDFGLRDKIKISDSKRGLTVEDYVSSITWTLTAPGPLNVEIGLGRPEQSASGRSGRSGGGRSGAGRKGGKPKSKAGEPGCARKITCSAGDLVFEQQDDEWQLDGDPGTRIRWYHVEQNDPTTEDQPEASRGYVIGNFVDDCPTCNGFVYLWDPVLNRDIMLLARDPGFAGGGGGGGTTPVLVPPGG